MSSYIHFTEEQKQRAAAVNLEEFLRCRGEKLLSSGREKRLASDHSVTVRGNEWYDHTALGADHTNYLRQVKAEKNTAALPCFSLL